MIIQSRRGPSGRSSSKLPAPIQARLNSIGRLKYREQVDALSHDYPHNDLGAYRWYSPFEDLPFMHIITTADHGNQMKLFVLAKHPHRLVFALQKDFSDWHVSTVLDERDLAEVIPNRFSEVNSSLFTKPASMPQIRTLAKQLGLPVRVLPRLTAFNANALLQYTLIKRHLPLVRGLLLSAMNQARAA